MPAKHPHEFAGRPLKNPKEKVGWPIRYLATPPVVNAIEALQDTLGIEYQSDVQRLAIYRLLEHYGLITPELQEDETFKNLRDRGFV